MGQLIVSEFVTLDGVMQARGGPEEDTEGGFKHGGWQAPFSDEESSSLITRDIERMDALLLGRKTYDIFAACWPKATTGEIVDKLNTAPKFVASPQPPQTRMEQFHSHPRRPFQGGGPHQAKTRRSPRDRKRQPRPDPTAARPRRPVQPIGLPAPARHRQETLR